jgi:putative SOS response-associated peptidase YedK
MRLTAPDQPLDFEPSYNVSPTQRAVIVRGAGGGREAMLASWGLRPAWMRSRKPPINARAETIATSPMFREALRSRRCVVPVSGFYEWQNVEGAKAKQPWYIHRADREPLLFAGLFENGPQGDTFTIITTDANATVRPVHDRMPVVLEPESVAAWLDGPDRGLLRPAADGVLSSHKVGAGVGSPRNNDAGLIAPI